jgi:hypothetical protein
MQMALEASLNRCYAAKRPRGTTLATETNIAIWYQYNAELSAKLANDATDPAERAQHTDDESAWLKIAKEQFVRAAKFFK